MALQTCSITLMTSTTDNYCTQTSSRASSSAVLQVYTSLTDIWAIGSIAGAWLCSRMTPSLSIQVCATFVHGIARLSARYTDIHWGDLLTMFAHNAADVQRLRQIYHYATDEHYLIQTAEEFGYHRDLNTSFLMPNDTSACRVIEVCNKERKARYRCIDYLNGDMFKCDIKDKAELVDAVNEQRRQDGISAGVSTEEIESKLITAEWFIDNYWYYRFYAPTGEVIQEGETPYEHGEHPFVFRFYPFINGEIHSFVADVIDVQRYINKLINLNHYLLQTSAKGLLAVPESALEGTRCWFHLSEGMD